MTINTNALADFLATQHWLVTGANGFIGGQLVAALLAYGARVTAVVRPQANVQALRAMQGRYPQTLRLHNTALATVVDKPDVVAHLAGQGSVALSREQPLVSHLGNACTLLDSLDYVRQHPTTRLIYASSAAVYGDNVATIKCEDVLGNPTSPYAADKQAGELMAAVFARCYGCTTVGLRYFNVYGVAQPWRGAAVSVLPRWIVAALQGQPLSLYGGDTNQQDFVAVDDAVQATLRAGVAPLAGNHIINVGSGDGMKLAALAQAVSQTVAAYTKRPPVMINDQPAPAGAPQGLVADITRARALLGYEPHASMNNTLAAMVAAIGQELNAA